MTLGEKYIKDSYIKELDYNTAIEASKKELRSMGINCRTDIYDNDAILDSPIYPANAELYDEFIDGSGFDTLEYFLYIAKRIEIDD